MIGAVIILYRPSKKTVNILFSQIINQVDMIYCIDNTDVNYELDISPNEKVRYLPLGKNMGIGYALNKGIELANADHCSHVLFLDQDSIPSFDMVKQLTIAEAELIKAKVRVAAVGPLFEDKKTKKRTSSIRRHFWGVEKRRISNSDIGPVLSDYIITSGALINLCVFEEIGGMLPELFIDLVDIEWGLRAKWHGLNSYIIPNAVMDHSIGEEYIKLGDKKIVTHSLLRYSYILRNTCFLLKRQSMGVQWRLISLLRLPFYIVFYTFLSKSCSNALYLFRACINGFRGRLGEIEL